MGNAERNPIQKALKVLAYLIQSTTAETGVRDLAAALRISPSSAHRLLGALADEGLVQQLPSSGRYVLGLEMLRLANIASARVPVRDAALRRMRALVDLCNETALLGVYDYGRQQMMFSTSVESGHSLRYAIELNKWLPVHAGASGLAILAFLEEEEIRSIIERTRLPALTDQTITEVHRLHTELAAIRQRGYAITRGQRIPGAVGLSAPIFGSDGRVLGDVCLTIPQQRFEPASVTHIARLLTDCAAGITSDTGGKPRHYSGRAA